MEQYHHPICEAGSRVAKNITIRAGRLSRSGAVPGMDADDVAQHLRLHLLKRDDRYDPMRGSYDTFADRLLVNCIASLAYPTERLCVERQWVDLDMPVRDETQGEAHALSETLAESDALYGAPTRLADETIGLALDVRHLLSRLTPAGHDVAIALTEMTATEAARELGVHRSTVYAHLKMIRQAAIELGLDAYVARPRHFRTSAGM